MWTRRSRAVPGAEDFVVGRVLHGLAAGAREEREARASIVSRMPTVSRLREPIWLSLAAAVAVSAADATLIQVRKDFFTGGFLAVDAATQWADRLAFALGSVLSDWSLAALIVVGVLAVASKLRLAPAARHVLAFGAAVLPFAAAMLVQYELARYLGDAIDVGLMFDLTGGRPSELLAVAAAHLATPAVLSGAACAGLLGFTWVAQRFSRRRSRHAMVVPGQGPGLRGLLMAVGLLFVALPVTGAMRVTSAVLDNGLGRKPSNQLLGALIETVTDVDRDGYGMLARPADPDMWDPRVSPYALDVPGNGLDEDGVGGDLPPGRALAPPAATMPVFTSRPDIVLVMLETFRADAMGAVVNGRRVTPVLEALAAKGYASHRAYSHNGYTVQSRYHLFAGSLPIVTGPTLLDDFKANGYEVAYFSAQDESFGADEYEPGFDRADVFYDARQDRTKRYTTFSTPGSLGVTASTLLERVSAFLDRRARDRPLFLYVNFYDTHYPYFHREMTALVSDRALRESDIRPGQALRVREAYFNAAANVDAAIGRLLDDVSAHLGHEAGIIVLADHGESLFDDDFLGHGHALNDVQTRIPLVIANLPVRLPDPVGQADLRGAILAALTGGASGRPSSEARGGDPLFQYLGKLHRPKQIAFVLDEGRFVYDFRSSRVGLPGGSWVAEGELAPGERRRFLELVHYWERLRLAQAAHEAQVAPRDTDDGQP